MTAKLVKARPKAVEYLPEWAKCCPEAIERDQALGEITVDIADSRLIPEAECACCNYRIPAAEEVMMLSGKGAGKRFPIDCLDLDEGPTA